MNDTQSLLDIARCGLPAATEYHCDLCQRRSTQVAREVAPGVTIWCDGELWMYFPADQVVAAMETRNRMAHDSPTARWEVRCDACGRPPAPSVRADQPWPMECQCRRPV
jgi:hypothetical protein